MTSVRNQRTEKETLQATACLCARYCANLARLDLIDRFALKISPSKKLRKGLLVRSHIHPNAISPASRRCIALFSRRTRFMDHSRRDFLKKSAVFTLATAGASLAPEYAAARQKPTLSELANYDALGLAELIRKKQISPLELVDDVIGRVERVNPKINAVLTKLFDVEKARGRAKQGIGDGPFAGVPGMLKNLTQYKDARIDAGSRLYARYIEKKGNVVQVNSPLIDAMERSGMIIAGVTNSPELGLIDTTEPVLYGATRNPWNTDYTAGGSSGGSAAAVAAGIVPLAHGSDAGGSIRIPACQCGVVGLKPTRERELGNTRLSSMGAESIILGSLASELCLSHSVRDTAAVLNAVEKNNNPLLPPVGFSA